MSELLNYILENEEAFKSKSRLASLYSDFAPQASTNPDGYVANLSAWRTALTHASRAGLLPSRNHSLVTAQVGNDLSKALDTRECGRPMGLGIVIGEAVANRDLIPLAEFESTQGSIYTQGKGWLNVPWRLVEWGLKQVGFGGKGRVEGGEFVVVANLEAATEALLKHLSENPPSSPLGRIYNPKTFTQTFPHLLNPSQTLTPSDIHHLFLFLARDRNLCSYNPSTGTIKLRTDISSTTLSSSPPEPVNDTDVTVATLKTLDLDLSSQIATLESRIGECDAKARANISTNRTTALAALRSKKLAERALEDRSKSRHQAQDVLNSIEAAADRVALVDALKAGSSVLRGLNEQVGGIEGVEATVDAFQDASDEGREIDEVISAGMAAGDRVDEGEVDEELEAMEQEANKEKRAAEEKSRKEKEEAEARETERRLAELGTPKEEPRKETVGEDTGKEASGRERDADVEESSQSLGRLSLEDKRSEPTLSQAQA